VLLKAFRERKYAFFKSHQWAPELKELPLFSTLHLFISKCWDISNRIRFPACSRISSHMCSPSCRKQPKHLLDQLDNFNLCMCKYKEQHTL
jgi:hypothetical protein